MAKVAGNSDHFNIQSNGRWTWNDHANLLEFVGHNPGADKQDKKGKGKQQQRGGMFDKKNADRGATPNMGSRAFGQGRQSRMPGHRSAGRQGVKHSGEHTHVTLDDVKNLAHNMLGEVDIISDTFTGMYRTDQFDEFLLFLLNYFHSFFEKRTHEQKPNPMNIEPSLREVQYYEDLCRFLEGAQKQLGRAYCVLVLGIGLEGQHHMSCGGSRVSSTYKDRSMYETFYSFCTFVVWISFRRREFDVVKKEIGRMLRSETFNPAIRVRNAPPPEQAEDKKEEGKEKETAAKLTPAEYRRRQGKRPPIKSIINQRSPALVSILPSPKEEAHWLFKRKDALSPSSLSKVAKEDLQENNLEEQFQHLHINVAKLKVGIVGEPLSQFNPMTLTPLDAETEEECNEDGDKQSSTRKESQMGSVTHRSPPAGEGGASRQVTGVSQVTTEAMSDED